MVFSSISFLYYFLPVVLLIYYAVPAALRNYVLLLASLIFYAYGEGKYLFLMISEIMAAYVFSIFIEKHRNDKKGKILCALSIMFSLSFLLFFKYAGFFAETFSDVTGISMGSLRIALPAGISFYTFQIISYTVDIYRGNSRTGRFSDFAAYVSMFPQLIAGPIVRYRDIEKELRKRSLSSESVSEGIRRFAIGLGKKVLIANQLAELVNIADNINEPTLSMHIFSILCYGLFVYFDFSGYSDMAIGIGRILGFHFMENFNYPFIAGSITEFWQRWHISLGSWFRDYVYIPLGGNRKGIKRQLVNISAVWMLTGLWHGAGWNFVLWGIYFAVILFIEKCGLLKTLKKHRIFSHIYVITVVAVSFAIFKGDMDYSFVSVINEETLYYIKSYMVVFLVAVTGATKAIKNFTEKIPERNRNVLEVIFILVLLILSTAYLVDGSFNPFLYFRF